MKGRNQYHIQMVVSLTPAVKTLLIVNGLIWVLGVIFLQETLLKNNLIFDYFGLSPGLAVKQFYLWQPFTYMFLHSPNLTHILFNSLILWWVGSELEQVWGRRSFIKYYLICGVGAGLLYCAALYIAALFLELNPGMFYVPTVGASGAIFGLMLAYGLLFGERVIYFMMIFPMKAKHFIMVLALIEVGTLLSSGLTGTVNNLAHLAGLVVGFGYLRGIKYVRKRRQRQWMKSAGRRLRLVVDNEDSQDENPTYH